jgi:hypothetical protein
MAECVRGKDCVFNLTVAPSVVKRIRFASAHPYCRGGKYEECALYARLLRGQSIPRNLMPDGSTGNYVEDAMGAGSPVAARVRARRIMVVDDSPVFATIAANTISLLPDTHVVQCHSYAEAAAELGKADFHLVVSGAGIGDGKTVHDIRALTSVPIVVFTGRPTSSTEAPSHSCVVMKATGPGALRAAVAGLLAP